MRKIFKIGSWDTRVINPYHTSNSVDIFGKKLIFGDKVLQITQGGQIYKNFYIGDNPSGNNKYPICFYNSGSNVNNLASITKSVLLKYDWDVNENSLLPYHSSRVGELSTHTYNGMKYTLSQLDLLFTQDKYSSLNEFMENNK